MTKTINNPFEGLVIRDNKLVYIRNYNKYKSLELNDSNMFIKTQEIDSFKPSDTFYNYNHLVLSDSYIDVEEFKTGKVFSLYLKYKKQIKEFNKIK